ncbi:ATP-dependent DNA ligase [Streptomyces sp. NPDC093982]
MNVTRVQPELVVEVDVARDSVGRWHHPARWHRTRPDLSPDEVARFGS